MESSALKVGLKVVIKSGPFANHPATALGPTDDGLNVRVVPDGDPSGNQRRVLVSVDDVFNANDIAQQIYILPRLLEFAATDLPVALPRALGNLNHNTAAYDMADYSGDVTPNMITAGQVQQAERITDPMDPALDRFRPSADIVKRYISRQVPGGFTDVEYMLALREQRDAMGFSPNVALVGETQSGKTMLVQVLAVLAAERDGLPKPYPIFTLSGSGGITGYDLYGQVTAVIINTRETLVWMNGLVPMACDCGGFLYLDEWNAVAPNQAISIHPILDTDRHFFVNTQRAVPDGHGGFSPEIVVANPKLWVLCTINPGYKGTQTIQEATSNRFRWLPWDYDEATEVALIPSKTVRILGEALREARASRTITVPVGTSALQRFNADCAMFGVENALWVFIGAFPPAERERVNTIIEDLGLLDLLNNEYPTAAFQSEAPPELASSWNDNSIGDDD